MKKTRGKILTTVIILILMFVGCSKIVLDNTPDEDLAPKELTQEDKDNYKNNVYKEMTLYLMQYDQVNAQLSETINQLGAGTIDSYAAYTSVENCKDDLDICWQSLNKIEAPEYLNKEQKEMFENSKSDIVNAIMTRTSAVKKVAKMLDTGEIQNSKLKEIEDLNAMANDDLIKGITTKKELDKIMGITTE